MLRHLFGPVNAFFGEQFLLPQRRRGECLTFDHRPGSDLVVGHGDTWDDVCARLPAGWRPDFIALYLPYRSIPRGLWQAPVPLVGLAGDWNLLWHHQRRCLPRVERVLTDSAGLDVLHRAGLAHGRPANIFGCELAYLEETADAPERDLGIVFCGNFHDAVQRTRLPWLGRLAELAERRRVVLTTNVYHDAYRGLLRRARIAFNRSVRGECNSRAVEAAACGALLFQEAGNADVAAHFRPGAEYIEYTDDNLEVLLDYYLEHEDERRAIAEAGQRRAREYTFTALWDRALAELERDLPALDLAARLRPGTADELLERTWQFLHGEPSADPPLADDLRRAVAERPRAAALHNALAVVLAHAAVPDGAGDWAGVVKALTAALDHEPMHAVARLNLAETHLLLGQGQQAAVQARRTLDLLDRHGPPPAAVLDAPRLPTAFDHFRVEWERAAWANAGRPADEAQAKVALLRWRLHALLACATGKLAHYYEAAACRPDLPATQAALGCALARAGHFAEAAAPLRRALAGNPFDLKAANALYHALGDTAAWPEQQALAERYRRLRRAAPTVVAPRDWFAPPTAYAPAAAAPTDLGPVVWEGDFTAVHSLALVNRELCRRLLERGCPVLPRQRSRLDPATPTLPLPAVLAEALARKQDEPAAVHVRQLWPPDWTPPAEGHWVVVQPWEFGSLPREWVEPLVRQVDEAWVPSAYVRRCYLKCGVPGDRVFVVPNGVDLALLQTRQPPFPLATHKRFKFLFVGGTIHRKGIDVLLRAYSAAFSAGDDVCLVVKDMGAATFYQGQTAEQAIAESRAAGGPEIEHLTRPLSAEEMAALYQSCDCLVQPYRGEGFGLPIAEAMAVGLPVIVTGYGAALDFCDASRAYLLPAVLGRFKEKRVEPFETLGLPWLAEPDGDLLRHYLRHVVEQPDEARARGRAAAAYAAEHLGWKRAAEAVLSRLRELRKRPLRRTTATPATVTVPGVPRRMRVSLCMIVKDEEKFLGKCLESAADLVDEIIVVDTGSTDRTRTVAAEHGARVVDFAWVDSFATARNESIRHATGQWIFWLDADETLDEANRRRLRELFAGLGDENVVYLMRQRSKVEGGPDTYCEVDHARLFRNRPDVRWEHRVHEQILLPVRRSGGEPRRTGVVIDHAGFSVPETQDGKVARNLRLLELELAERPDDSFTLFNLAGVRLKEGRMQEALALLRRSRDCARPGDTLLRKLHAMLVRAHAGLGQVEEALAACRAGLEQFSDDGELLFHRALLLHGRADHAGAAAALERILEVPAPEHFGSVDAGLYGYRTRNFLATVYRDQGRLKEAESQWRAAVAECPAFSLAWRELARLYAEQGRWPEVLEVAGRLDADPETATDGLLLRGRAYLARKEFAAAREQLRAAIARAPQAVLPRVLLSYTFLQEGSDWSAAEAALLEVLALDPNHAEARRNLEVVRRQTARSPSPQRGERGQVPVSVCIIARNEEKNLPGSLGPLAGLGAELVVVDTGSGDRTREIARDFGARVFDFPWVDSFSAARNESLRHATRPWVFWLDCDDRLDAENLARLAALFATLKDEGAAYVMKCLCLPDGEGVATEVDHLRLFRNHPELRWAFRVHEQILPAVRRLGHEVRRADVVIHHTGYRDPALRARKFQRDLRLLRLELAEQPDNPFTLFNLGMSYHEQGQTAEALPLLRRSLELSGPGDSIVRKLYALLVQCHQRLGQTREALTVCRGGLTCCPEDLELLFLEGVALNAAGDVAGAVRSWERCLAQPAGAYLACVNPGLRGHVTRHNLARAYRDLDRPAEAEAQWRAALAERPDFAPAWRGLLGLLVRQGRWEDVEALARERAVRPDGEWQAAVVRVRGLLGRHQFGEARGLARECMGRWPTAVEFQELLTYTWLQEGRDWPAAERALRNLLQVAPDNAEARRNLDLLLRQQGRAQEGPTLPDVSA
jgi:glycosyltransferase involved in cell wall biosynthesis